MGFFAVPHETIIFLACLQTSEKFRKFPHLLFCTFFLSSLSYLSYCSHGWKSPSARGTILACPKAITSSAISYSQLNILQTDAV